MQRVTTVAAPVAHLVGPGKLKVINGRLAYATGEASPLRLDARALTRICCYGPVGLTDEALQLLLAASVNVAFLSPGGRRCLGRIVRSDPSSASLRLVQHAVLADPTNRLELARAIIAAKIQSQQEAARHWQRHGCRVAGEVHRTLAEAQIRCGAARSLDSLRGVEGSATAAWFRVVAAALRPPWEFPGRVRRPPTDPVNALLSLGYTFLTTRTGARAEATGLELYLGALHEFRPGRPAVACDLVEPLRVPTVDRWILTICNEGRLAPHDFDHSPEQGTRLRPDVFPTVVESWETHWLRGEHEARLEATVETFVQMLRCRSHLV